MIHKPSATRKAGKGYGWTPSFSYFFSLKQRRELWSQCNKMLTAVKSGWSIHGFLLCYFHWFFGMFELFHIKIKMFKIKIANLFIFPVKWYFLNLQMADCITFMVLKYFNDYHTPKSSSAVFVLFLRTVLGRKGEYRTMTVWVCVYVKATAHERLGTLGRKGNFYSRTQMERNRGWKQSDSCNRLNEIIKS